LAPYSASSHNILSKGKWEKSSRLSMHPPLIIMRAEEEVEAEIKVLACHLVFFNSTPEERVWCRGI
jgi:hypothetical protein